ncbi:MAG: helix-turn-helix domain-containing protein [Christensenellales bacterium]
MEIVGQRLKALRESMGISQAKIALLLDSKQPNINRFEHNQSEPPLALLCRYADFFDVSLDYILGRTDQPQESCTNTSQPILLNGRTCGALSRCALILRRLQMPS